MSVTKKDVEYIAQLARLEFSEAEKDKLTTDLNAVLGYMDKLNELDTTGVEPLTNMSDNENVLRADLVCQPITNAEALLNAPDKTDRFFKVPKVITQVS
jgi:aspartyl-tRNA(Asn)/glutamyl-tRNA(Gln) amidotransferase subunit C